MVAFNFKCRYQVSIVLLFCVQTSNKLTNTPHMNIINLSFQLLCPTQYLFESFAVKKTFSEIQFTQYWNHLRKG